MMASTMNGHKRQRGTLVSTPPMLIPTHLAHTQHDNGPTTWDNDDAARTRTTVAEVRKAQDKEATAQERHNQDMQGRHVRTTMTR